MTEGTSTFEGLALPRLGEYEQVQQTAANDMVSLTGASGMTGDFVVYQNSTGGEVFVVSSSGKYTPASGESTFTLSSTSNVSALNVDVTSTGAIDHVGAVNSAFMVTGSTKSVLNACYGYNGGAEGIPPTTFFVTSGSASPEYFLTFGATKAGFGAAADGGFFDSAHKLLNLTSDTIFGVIKILAGSKCYHMLSVVDTWTVAQ